MNREFQKGELVLLMKPEKDGFTPVIFIEDLEFEEPSLYQVLDTETGETLVVGARRIAKVSEDT
jgi:hypothetical protein